MGRKVRYRIRAITACNLQVGYQHQFENFFMYRYETEKKSECLFYNQKHVVEFQMKYVPVVPLRRYLVNHGDKGDVNCSFRFLKEQIRFNEQNIRKT